MKSRNELAHIERLTRQTLVDVALGRTYADLVIVGGKLLNVYTGEIMENASVAVKGDRIAAVGGVAYTIGPNTKVIDAHGEYLVPGFVDAHYHIESSRLSPRRHAELTLPRGLTVLVEDPHEACASGGLDAIRYILESTEGLPQKVYVQVSSATPPSNVETTGGFIGKDEFEESLNWPRVLGLGELMDPPRIFGKDERTWGLIEQAILHSQPMEGHNGFTGKTLAAYASCGVMSTHSPRTPERALEMLRNGFYLQLKVEREEDTIRHLLQSRIDWSKVGLAVDDRPVEKILEYGSLDNEVRAAIKLGIPPITAYQMATINNARHFGLDKDHGGIAPGRYADILFIADLENVTISRVIASGVEVAQEGELTVTFGGFPTPSYALNTVHLKKRMSAQDFAVKAGARIGSCKAMVIRPFDFSGDLTQALVELPVRDGEIVPEPNSGINKVAIVERHKATGNMGICFMRWGFTSGAVALSVLHDSHNISVVGASDEDMAIAVNRVADMGGGIVVVLEGKVLAELRLPVFGMMSDEDPLTVAQANAAVEKAAASLRMKGIGQEALGMPSPDLARTLDQKPVDVLTFAFLTCDPRRFVLTDRGIFDMADERALPLIW